ncbi:MAG: manganese efflux pump MntP family protein [Prevotella sp.]|nr:manganese efflux pump MntP family protein [Prevotella sp.]
MNLLDIILLSIALAMDCFTVSIASGFILRVKSWRVILQISFLFGFFQAFMPLVGWLSMGYFTQYVESFGHWLAFGLLAFLGGKMIYESFLPAEHRTFNPCKLRTQLLLAVATSIDAFAVGISLAVTGFTTLLSLVEPLIWIGLGSFLFGVVGHLLGIRFGNLARHNIRPELLGGIILVAIGVKVLLS